MTGSARIVRGNALALPLDDSTVDLIVTSPPYFGLRSYQDGGEHYAGQIGSEATPAEFVDALIAATREMVRVLKPSGSIWVNLGDKYAGSSGGGGGRQMQDDHAKSAIVTDVRAKSLIGVPWRYAIRCIDDLGLILRANVIWSKPNGLPESVTDRVRRSHEDWFHFTLNPRYYSAVDEIREAHVYPLDAGRARKGYVGKESAPAQYGNTAGDASLGKLPGSVWTIPTEPLHVPDHLGIDHFAAFPTEWPRRIIQGWSPRGICVECGEGRRPVSDRATVVLSSTNGHVSAVPNKPDGREGARKALNISVTGYACACPEPTAPTTPAVILDPFGGTGTTALVAHALGRHGISVDMSADYCRLAGWRTSDPKQQTKAARREYVPPREQTEGQLDLLEGIA